MRMKIVGEGEGRAIRQRSSKEVYIQVEVRRGSCVSRFSTEWKVDTIYRTTNAKLQCTTAKLSGMMNITSTVLGGLSVSLSLSRFSRASAAIKLAKAKKPKGNSAVGIFFPSGRTKHPVLSRAADAGRNGSRVRGYSALARFWNR